MEDDFLITLWAEEALSGAGYDVISVTNADDAVAVLERDSSIRLVITDIDMPGSIDGLKLAAAVRDRWPPVQIIIASGKHRPLAAEMPSEAVFLPKPYLSNDILGAVRHFL